MQAAGASWMTVAGAFAFLSTWFVNLGGSIVALILFIRYRHPASLLALVGFGLSAIPGPILTLSQSFVASRLGLRGLAVLTSFNGLLDFVATLALVAALWLALRKRNTVEDERV